MNLISFYKGLRVWAKRGWSDHAPQFVKQAIFGKYSADDVRLFLTSETACTDYPSLDYLVDWARKHDFKWRIEQDIFILRNRA